MSKRKTKEKVVDLFEALKQSLAGGTMLTEPIVEGASHDKAVGDVVDCLVFALNRGVPKERLVKLVCAVIEGVYLVPTDPREVVAELRAKSVQWEPPGEVYGEDANLRAGYSYAFDEAADLVASKLVGER